MARRAAVLSAAVCLIGLAALEGSTARGEQVQQGNLIVSLNGGIKPRELPRRHTAPVTVRLAGGGRTSDGSPLPRVNWIKLELAWRGELYTEGLPVCPRERLRSTVSGQAKRLCGGALVGRGRLNAKVYVPNQAPFGVRARLLAFNGRTKEGTEAVWVHAYSSDPPVSFILPFEVRHRPGTFRTVLMTTIRRAVGPWPHVSNFDITISRQFFHRGKLRSYLNASCPVPRQFTAGFLSFARATYAFAGGHELRTETVRSCRAR